MPSDESNPTGPDEEVVADTDPQTEEAEASEQADQSPSVTAPTSTVAAIAATATASVQQAAADVAAVVSQTSENVVAATATATQATVAAAQQAGAVVTQATQQASTVVTQATQSAQATLQQAGQRATVSPSKAVYRGRRFAVGFSLTMMGLAFLAGLARRYKILPGDVGLARGIQQFDSPPVNLVMQLISELGWQIPSVISRTTFSAVMWAAGFRMEGAATATTFSADLVTMIVKQIVHRPRPTPDLVRRIHNLGETSFPSGHVVHYVTFYGFLFYLFFTHLKAGRGRNALLCLLAFLVLLVGPSRVYMGEHWPSDVAGAYLVGSLWLSVEIIAYLEMKSRFQMLSGWPFLSKRSRPIQ